MPGDSDYLLEGDWNVVCDLCGRKVKACRTEKTWDNFYVCRHHKEARNPQDYLRGVKDDQTVPFSRPEPPLQFVTSSFRLLQLNGSAILQLPDAFGNEFNILVA
jgi:hypothetical protein